VKPEATSEPITGLERLWRPFSPPTQAPDEGGPFLFVRGEGVWLETAAGQRCLDGVGALEAMAIGHGRSELAVVAERQMRELAFLDVFRHVSQPALDLAEELVRIAPPGIERVHFTPGGSEAVEVALKLALQYHWLRGEPERRKVIVRRGAYHGVTFGAMNCDGGYYSTRNDIYLGDQRFGVVAGAEGSSADWGAGARHSAGASDFARAIEEVGPDRVAALVVDPIGTASGVSCAPAEDLQELRRLCDEHGILLIVDEVITGFCRTGAWFASSLYDVEPDLIPVSKALSSGYMPIGATLIGQRLAAAFAATDGVDELFAHGHTYGGHPVACAVALENIRILERENLAERAAIQGETLRGALRARLGSRDAVVDVRGVGMLNGVELIGEDAAAGSLGSAREAAAWVRRRCAALGLVTLTVHPGTVLLLAPPLVIEDWEIDALAEILDHAVGDLEAIL
jgi:putrescine aminotransferase